MAALLEYRLHYSRMGYVTPARTCYHTMHFQVWWNMPSSKAAVVDRPGEERNLCLGECYPVSWRPDPTRYVRHVLICETQPNTGWQQRKQIWRTIFVLHTYRRTKKCEESVRLWRRLADVVHWPLNGTNLCPISSCTLRVLSSGNKWKTIQGSGWTVDNSSVVA